VFSGNVATQQGGGLYVKGTSIYWESDVQLEGLIFENNTAATSGGGLYSLSPTRLTLGASQFISNSAGFGGGAFFNAGGTGVSEIVGNTFQANSASEQGGGLMIDSLMGTTRFVNNIADLNSAGAGGGGLYVTARFARSNIELVNNTLVNNVSELTGGGVVAKPNMDFENASIVFINNAISHNQAPMARNAYFNNVRDGFAQPIEILNNAFDGVDSYDSDMGVLVGPSNIQIDADAYTNIDGADYLPAAESPLIDAGVTTEITPSVDFLYKPRDASPDIGAFER
jgi:predicted outer membrane repeat protein